MRSLIQIKLYNHHHQIKPMGGIANDGLHFRYGSRLFKCFATVNLDSVLVEHRPT